MNFRENDIFPGLDFHDKKVCLDSLTRACRPVSNDSWGSEGTSEKNLYFNTSEWPALSLEEIPVYFQYISYFSSIPGDADKMDCVWGCTRRKLLKVLVWFKKDYGEYLMAIFW